jgi:hypothetical protein
MRERKSREPQAGQPPPGCATHGVRLKEQEFEQEWAFPRYHIDLKAINSGVIAPQGLGRVRSFPIRRRCHLRQPGGLVRGRPQQKAQL